MQKNCYELRKKKNPIVIPHKISIRRDDYVIIVLFYNMKSTNNL